MKLVIRIVVILLVIGALAGGGYWLYLTRFAPAPAGPRTFTQIVPVRQGSLSNTLSEVGELDALSSQDLAFTHVDGVTTLKTLNVVTGNKVKAGQVLATIDNQAYQQALDQAKSDLQAAEKKLSDLQTPATTLSIAQADLASAQAEYNLAKAKQDLADVGAPDLATLQSAVQDAQDALDQLALKEKLGERDSLAKSERDLGYTIAYYQRRINELTNQKRKNLEETQELTDRQAKLLDLQAELASVQAQRNLAKLALAVEKTKDQAALADAQKALSDAKAGGAQLDVAKAQLAVQTAQVALDKAKDDRTQLDVGPDATALATAQADVDKKKLAVNDAQAALDGTELKADIDGTVLNTNLQVGDQVTSSTIVLTVADLSQLQVVASVDETTVRRVSQGQTADISFDAFPGQSFKGTVLAVPLQGALQNDVMVYQVPLSLEGADKLPLLVGMTANVDIQTAQAQDALLVPTIALQQVKGNYQVMLVNPNDPKADPIPTPVQIGLSDGINTQIVQGLKEGDQVVVTIQAATNGQNGVFFGGGFGGGGGFVVPAGGFNGGGNNRGGNNGGGRTTRP